MTDVQVIFRVDKKMLKELDASLPPRGFKTRNEWFRHEIREFLGIMKEREALKDVKEEKEAFEITGIKEKARVVLQRHGVRKAALFGSAARGELTKDSDIDVLVEFEGRKSLLDLAGLKNELEEVLGRKVDVLTYNSLHPLLKDSILKEQEAII
jgi:predicted nucleotidyltransferase